MENYNLSMIIVEYNSMDRTIIYLKDVVGNIAESDNMNIIIVDNSENRNSFMRFCAYFGIDSNTESNESYMECCVWQYENILSFRTVTYIFTTHNLGYAQANNIGVKYAKEILLCRYAIISNNDICFPQKIDISRMISIIQSDNEIAIVGPRQVYQSNGNDINPFKELSPKDRFFTNVWCNISQKIKFVDRLSYTGESKKCYSLNGSFLVMDVEKFMEVGGFDSHTFLYGEEEILSERLHYKGYTYYFYNDIMIVHEAGTVTKNFQSNWDKNDQIFASLLYYYGAYKGVNWIWRLIWRLNYFIYKKVINLRKHTNGITLRRVMQRKFESYFYISDKWLWLKGQNSSLEYFFRRYEYQSVAIYGLGKMGVHLLNELSELDAEVGYIIDQKTVKYVNGNIPVYHMRDNLPVVDVIIVTPTFDFANIAKELREKVNCPVVSLESVVDECFFREKYLIRNGEK